MGKSRTKLNGAQEQQPAVAVEARRARPNTAALFTQLKFVVAQRERTARLRAEAAAEDNAQYSRPNYDN
jgi:hypothetical protein